ncbi:hypothetical protein [Streptomonospora salina]|uniref:Uncharacterized protein n=1 Tax=Streptomonospora salina TaxID=104205 RepID=A0A841EJ92_9ACTN|nr:hypothetical protein [Streptomonospora salina]MBB6000868.1 hypothetical protein [Streptomonospora salina]
MPRVDIPVTTITRDGVAGAAEVTGDPANGHAVANTSGRTVLVVSNSSVDTAQDVTLVTQATVDGQDVADRTVSVPFGETRYIGGLPEGVYGREIHIDITSADLSFQAFTFPR